MKKYLHIISYMTNNKEDFENIEDYTNLVAKIQEQFNDFSGSNDYAPCLMKILNNLKST